MAYCLNCLGVFSMIEFLDAFSDVFLWPVDPQNLNFENNPVMIVLSTILVTMGIVRVLRMIFL